MTSYQHDIPSGPVWSSLDHYDQYLLTLPPHSFDHLYLPYDPDGPFPTYCEVCLTPNETGIYDCGGPHGDRQQGIWTTPSHWSMWTRQENIAVGRATIRPSAAYLRTEWSMSLEEIWYLCYAWLTKPGADKMWGQLKVIMRMIEAHFPWELPITKHDWGSYESHCAYWHPEWEVVSSEDVTDWSDL